MKKKNDFLSQTCYAFLSKWFFLFLPVRASLISPPDLMIQISGWCQNVANTCRYNLTESDFLFSISLIQKEKFALIFPTSSKNLPKKSTNNIFLNRALLNCSGKCWLQPEICRIRSGGEIRDAWTPTFLTLNLRITLEQLNILRSNFYCALFRTRDTFPENFS